MELIAVRRVANEAAITDVDLDKLDVGQDTTSRVIAAYYV